MIKLFLASITVLFAVAAHAEGDTFTYSTNASGSKSTLKWKDGAIDLPVKAKVLREIVSELTSAKLDSDPMRPQVKTAKFNDNDALRLVASQSSAPTQMIMGNYQWFIHKDDGVHNDVFLKTGNEKPVPWPKGKPMKITTTVEGEKVLSTWCLLRGPLFLPSATEGESEGTPTISWAAYRSKETCN
jgi:hypothetical protein